MMSDEDDIDIDPEIEKSMKKRNELALETQKRTMKNIESWLENKECWERVFLSWNRSNPHPYGNFPRELQARAREKGLDLIIDRTFHPSLLDQHHHLFNRRPPVAFILVSVDYLSSKSCMLELLSIRKSRLELAPIAYYTDHERKVNPHLQGDYEDFMHRAKTTIGSEEYHSYFDFFIKLSMTYLKPRSCNSIPYNPISARDDDAFLAKFIDYRTLFVFEWLPDYNTFHSLCLLAEKLHLEYFSPCAQSPIMYLGFLSGDISYNTFAAQSVCSPARISGFRHYHIDMLIDCPYNDRSDKPYEDLFVTGLYYVNCILGTGLYSEYYDQPDVLYKSILTVLPKNKKCLFLIQNVPYYDYLKAIANVLDFVCPDSRIVFTTTNENFFSGSSSTPIFSQEPSYCGDCLPTLYVRQGQILAVEELQHLKTVQERVTLKPKISKLLVNISKRRIRKSR